jgi:hypothetical protein
MFFKQEALRLSEFPGASLLACHGLMISAGIHILAKTIANDKIPTSL